MSEHKETVKMNEVFYERPDGWGSWGEIKQYVWLANSLNEVAKLVKDLPGENVVEKVRGMRAVIERMPVDADGNPLIPQPKTVYTFNAKCEIYWVNVDWMTWHSSVDDEGFEHIDHWSVSGRNQFDEHSNIEAKECYLTRESARIGLDKWLKKNDEWVVRAAAQKAVGDNTDGS